MTDKFRPDAALLPLMPADMRAAFGGERARQTDLKVGDRVPMPERKLDIRPAFTGSGKPSFKPARHGNRGPGK